MLGATVAAGGYGNESVVHDRRTRIVDRLRGGWRSRWYIWRPDGVHAIELDPAGRGEGRFLRLCSPRYCAILLHNLCEHEDRTVDYLGQERLSITTTTYYYYV